MNDNNSQNDNKPRQQAEEIIGVVIGVVVAIFAGSFIFLYGLSGASYDESEVGVINGEFEGFSATDLFGFNQGLTGEERLEMVGGENVDSEDDSESSGNSR